MSANRARYLKTKYEQRTKEQELQELIKLIYSAAAEGKSAIVYVSKYSEFSTKELIEQGYRVNPVLSDILEISW